MTTDRAYRAALPVDVALMEIRRGAGAQFDPHVAAALIEVVERQPQPSGTLTKHEATGNHEPLRVGSP